MLTSKLTPRQAAEWKMLEGGDPAQEHALATASNAKHIAQMDAVSPAGHLSELHAPVYLLHGAADDVIPPTELSWLQRDIPAGLLRGSLESRIISHVSFGQSRPSLADYWRGLRFLAHFLQAASA
jgi:pimeloyl-ACP methyl ester carboxylesterase